MKITVVGYFNKSNLGDDLFIEAFKTLFPDYTFSFTEWLTCDQVDRSDAVFFGGGSYLDGPILGELSVIDRFDTKPLFYVGVGAETNIHTSHKNLMRKAKLIAIRSQKHLPKIKQLNNNTIVIPDIVAALGSKTKINRISKSVLYIPNVYVVPTWDEAHWKHVAFATFKCEMAQALDHLVSDGWLLRFLPFCSGNVENDLWCAQEIINSLKNRHNDYLAGTCKTYQELNNLISDFELVITQRYHGIIAAELSLTPYISLYHHDKLKSGIYDTGSFLNYYESSKSSILNSVAKSQQQIVNTFNPSKFNVLKEKVKEILENAHK